MARGGDAFTAPGVVVGRPGFASPDAGWSFGRTEESWEDRRVVETNVQTFCVPL